MWLVKSIFGSHHDTLQSKQTTIKHVFNITSAKFCQEIMSLVPMYAGNPYMLPLA
jgi:hypothetical protein